MLYPFAPVFAQAQVFETMALQRRKAAYGLTHRFILYWTGKQFVIRRYEYVEGQSDGRPIAARLRDRWQFHSEIAGFKFFAEANARFMKEVESHGSDRFEVMLY